MQVTELPLNALISINFDAVDKCGPGALYSVFDVNMLQVDLPEALGPEQMVDVLMATSASFCVVDFIVRIVLFLFNIKLRNSCVYIE